MTDKPSGAIDALIQQLEDSIHEQYRFNEVQDMLIELKGKVEAEKQAYAEQEVTSALEKIQFKILCIEEVNNGKWNRSDVRALKKYVAYLLSESSSEGEKMK